MSMDKPGELSPQGVPVVERIPLRGIARFTAQTMLKSHLEYAELTSMVETDFTKLIYFREQLIGDTEHSKDRISITHIVIKAIAVALQDHPLLNAILVENEIKILEEINIGIAVAMENGQLVVPIIRNADKKSLLDIAKESNLLMGKARAGQIGLEDVEGGTFTFSNFGMLKGGGDITTPIILPPQSAILAMGRIVSKPVVLNEEIVIRQMAWLSLTCDHRIINGVQAADFNHVLNELIQNPARLQ
ncbi:MAG: 2-oxo acid dehydrogenase subunit E2 [Anaerolineales bacterium]|nr:2-oxo acid dehydrogenase subunit E2 [Anaerolineales bacterium]